MSQQKKALDMNEALATSEAFLIKYRKWVIGGSIAVLVLIAAWVGSIFYFKSQNQLGQYELSLGERYVQTGDWEKAIKAMAPRSRDTRRSRAIIPAPMRPTLRTSTAVWVISTWAITKRPSLNSRLLAQG